jgi:hypothetical protein
MKRSKCSSTNETKIKNGNIRMLKFWSLFKLKARYLPKCLSFLHFQLIKVSKAKVVYYVKICSLATYLVCKSNIIEPDGTIQEESAKIHNSPKLNFYYVIFVVFNAVHTLIYILEKQKGQFISSMRLSAHRKRKTHAYTTTWNIL